MGDSLKQRVESLTDRELACLRGVAEHKRTDQIAGDVGLAPKTVDAYIAKASKRLGVNDRDSAVRLLGEASRMPWGKSLTAFSGIAGPAAPASLRWLSRLPWPWPTRWRPENDHSFTSKIAMIIAIAAGMMLATAAYFLMVIAIAEHF